MQKLRAFVTHPIVAALSLIFAVLLGIFSIWSHLSNQPQREISFWVERQEFADMALAIGLTIPVQGIPVAAGEIELVTISIWNSGNQEIQADHFQRPLKIVTTQSWLEHKIEYFGLDEADIIGNFSDGAKIKAVFPNSGLRIRFLSNNAFEDIDITGAISGGKQATRGVAENKFLGSLTVSKRQGFYGTIFTIFSLAALVLISRRMILRLLNTELSLGERFFAGFYVALACLFLSFVTSVLIWNYHYAPPF